MKPVILFDLDGTLIDSTEAILESFYHALSTYQEVNQITDQMITSQIGHPLSVMFESLGVKKVEEHIQTYKLHYRHISREKTVMLPNAIDAVKEASEFARLGIVTTKTALYSKELMEHFGIMDRFEVLIGFENVENLKPHPEPILKALTHMNVRDQVVWMIGDTRLDLESSQRAGVRAIGVLSGYDNLEQLSRFNFEIKRDVLEAVRHIAKGG